ncbi:MAG: helix-turn-helix domain-containing protein [Mesorhizobium sp.]|nr:helix-turn-helix domain-containing protein [Mesorhizobium sp. M4B.F.Ca.ET.058.02.1.1]RUX49318.1 helix-turn-helix domain-containing protein [Mesorhizobium sp. M4A.F.Ca.ET.050.02.1.1]RVC45684.1 helix-turn-helix domain-containing protein [Mesorhizobium sp. M4A.F.Ca.ET.090.04.2.1]RVC74738.1 helix-turn-helix domain-containing protein [Mesorhizobium sp. M4A.F.Ca.ET.022.05.2.1]RVD39576.1 helix-turn-helix domain-containing protein [Mesorhizobium sp. M4A.F.Ca.ET.020.02.1.1]RWC16082.1 MAG: helix-turn
MLLRSSSASPVKPSCFGSHGAALSGRRRKLSRATEEGASPQLPDSTELRILEIAVACGFESPSHFSKTFREHFGEAPNSVRALAHGRRGGLRCAAGDLSVTPQASGPKHQNYR